LFVSSVYHSLDGARRVLSKLFAQGVELKPNVLSINVTSLEGKQWVGWDGKGRSSNTGGTEEMTSIHEVLYKPASLR